VLDPPDELDVLDPPELDVLEPPELDVLDAPDDPPLDPPDDPLDPPDDPPEAPLDPLDDPPDAPDDPLDPPDDPLDPPPSGRPRPKTSAGSPAGFSSPPPVDPTAQPTATAEATIPIHNALRGDGRMRGGTQAREPSSPPRDEMPRILADLARRDPPPSKIGSVLPIFGTPTPGRSPSLQNRQRAAHFRDAHPRPIPLPPK